MSKTENNILLFSITLCWAASYVFIKDLPSSLSSYGYLTMTCGIAAVLLTIVFWKKLKIINWSIVWRAAILSVLLALNLLLDKLGIDRLTSSTASALASASILIVPILLLFLKKPPTPNNFLGALVIMIGIVVTSGFSVGSIFCLGGLFMLLSAVAVSIYTIFADKVTKEEDPLVLSILQMWFCTVFGFVLWFIEDPMTFFNVDYSREMLSSIFILAFFAKAYAYAALMYSQKYSDPISVTIIASTEPIVTLLLAVLIPSAFTESFTAASVGGTVIIAIGAVISEMNFLSRKRSGKAYE